MNLAALKLPDYRSSLRIDESRNTIFDSIRKKHVALTPEEWVRQNFLRYMLDELGYPAGLVAVEMPIVFNGMQRRCDMVAYNQNMQPRLIVECKAPSVNITQKTFDQIATYNLQLNVEYLMVTNGLVHYCCKIDFANNNYTFLDYLPSYNQLK